MNHNKWNNCGHFFASNTMNNNNNKKKISLHFEMKKNAIIQSTQQNFHSDCIESTDFVSLLLIFWSILWLDEMSYVHLWKFIVSVNIYAHDKIKKFHKMFINVREMTEKGIQKKTSTTFDCNRHFRTIPLLKFFAIVIICSPYTLLYRFSKAFNSIPWTFCWWKFRFESRKIKMSVRMQKLLLPM